jgi:hypothetical protein
MPDAALNGALTTLDTLLISGMGVMAATIGTLFWQLQKSNMREVEAYKTCAPLVARLIELCERLKEIVSRQDRGEKP